jgi:hypothetical protein
MSKTRNRKLPEVGSLVRLKTYDGTLDHIKVEMVDSADMEAESAVRSFDPGTLAIVTGQTMNYVRGEPCPTVLVGSFQGWIFPDECESVSKNHNGDRPKIVE